MSSASNKRPASAANEPAAKKTKAKKQVIVLVLIYEEQCDNRTIVVPVSKLAISMSLLKRELSDFPNSMYDTWFDADTNKLVEYEGEENDDTDRHEKEGHVHLLDMLDSIKDSECDSFTPSEDQEVVFVQMVITYD